ncbi:MAG: hypothetical protein ACK55I_27190, partial [bacterium]
GIAKSGYGVAKWGEVQQQCWGDIAKSGYGVAKWGQGGAAMLECGVAKWGEVWRSKEEWYEQRCETVTIFTVPVPTFEKFWFRFRFQLLKSYGSGSGSYF